MVETTEVIIVGAGPSGLGLGLSLARYNIKSVILEKDTEVTADPRGVYLTGDAVRILHSLGLGSEMDNIGHELPHVNFHRSRFNTDPFFSLNVGSSNSLQQSLPEGMLQMQPRLERALRREVERSKECTIRTGCTVVAQSSIDPLVVEYIDQNDKHHRILGQWLVGADGKTGVVRKQFLEPTAGIRQEDGLYPYNGTWVAANLSICLPTQATHPQFPLWEMGYSPEQVYDLFWPKGWHFCSPPGKATASGRFGPHSERIWRHEFREDNWNETMDAVELLWANITPMITLGSDAKGRKFPEMIPYPLDCVKVLRCRPFHFAHKVVNRWFHKRTVLIGDAAHVFPPFAGQGIASGIRDAHQLAWRLALLVRHQAPGLSFCNYFLETWEHERRKSVDNAALLSMLNGRLCNYEPPTWVLILLKARGLLEYVPALRHLADPLGLQERQGFTTVDDGFFFRKYNGGARMAQIYLQSSSGELLLSDYLLQRATSIFTIVVISPNGEHARLYGEAKTAINGALISSNIISEDSLIIFSPRPDSFTSFLPSDGDNTSAVEVFCPAVGLKNTTGRSKASDHSAYIDRLGRSTRFAIVRPDLFVFSCSKDVDGLVKCLSYLRGRVDGK